MKNRLLILCCIIILSGCKSLGSWYGLIPEPQKTIDLNEDFTDGYTIERVVYNNMIYDLIVLNPKKIKLKIIKSENNKGISYTSLERDSLLFAVNGGIYQENWQPLGYLTIDGSEKHGLNRSDGYGNFYLKPNGVFFLIDQKAEIMETERFQFFLESTGSTPQLAIQSGPLLVYNNQIHQAFTQSSANKYVRNAIGIIENDNSSNIVIVISNKPVNFFDFALFFKEFLKCKEALYLDGHISTMYLPDLDRYQTGQSYGTIIYSLKP